MRSSSPYVGIILLLFCSLPPLAILLAVPTFSAQAPATQDRKAEADRLLEQGNQQSNHSQYQEALQSWQQALDIYQEIGDPNGEATSLNNLGNAYSSLGQYLKAIEYYEQSLAIFQAIDNPKGKAYSLMGLGNAYNRLGQYPKAIEFYEQSLAIARKIDDRNGEAYSLNNLGEAYSRLGQYLKAIKYYEQSLAIARKIDDRNGEASSLNNLGAAYSSQGQYPKAIEHYEQSLAIARKIGDRNGEASSLNNLGNAYNSLGQYPKAIEYYEQSLAIQKEISDRNGEASSLNNLGNAYNSLGQYPKAIEYYEQSLAIAQDIGDRQEEARSLMGLGNAYNSLGQYPKAIEHYEQSLAIAQDIGDRQEEARSLNNLGEVYRSQGQYPKAIEYYEQSLAIKRKIGDRNGEAYSLNNLGIAYSNLEQYSKAIELYEQSLAIARKIGDRNGEAYSLNNLGIVFLQTHELEKATIFLLDAAQALESLRAGLTDIDKVQFLETQTNAYRALQLALVAQDKTDDALVAAERGRSRAFIEQLAQRLGSQTVEDLITQNIPTLDQLKQIAAQHNVTLVEYSFVYDQKVRDPNGQLYTWVVKPTEEIIFQQADLSTLNTSLADLVDSSREAIGVTRGIVGVRPRPGTEEQQAQRLKQLYQLLIEPIDDLLPSDPNAPVIFVPQGELFSVPFAALQDAKGQYLIDQHTVLTSPSIQLLDKTRQQQAQVKQANLHDVLVVGNPTMPHVSLAGEPPQQLSTLAGAEKEAKAIAPLLQTQPLLGGQAKKTTVMQRMEQARMIHLATHGILDDRQGLESAIALAPDGTGELNDGLLTAAEIAQMKLHAELVVLSACDTAQGRITGDGVIGLSRALITAGVPSVLVSLWSVPDAPTAELMTEFYQQLQHTDNKAQALRQAMLATKAKHPSPRDWAGFTLIGEAQ
jgi:CHAT domain-containing protein/uncharacterized protein HemY